MITIDSPIENIAINYFHSKWKRNVLRNTMDHLN